MIYEGVEGLYKLHHEYYETAELHIDSLPRREIAFNSFSKGFHSWNRHNTFDTTDEIKEFIQKRNPPAGLFASTGHFLDPQIKCMTLRGTGVGSQSNWLGNDFILDLDKKMKPDQTRYEFLQEMSELTLELIDDFLIPLGFEEKDIKIDFSGNKGFHLGVTTSEYIEMSKENRTHILDYLTGKKLDKSTIFKNNKMSNYGWGRQGVRLIEHLLKLNDSSNGLQKEDLWMFPKTYHKQITNMFTSEASRGLKKGRLFISNTPSEKKLVEILSGGVVNYHAERLGSIIDRKPTIDKNRILRVPGSIHGLSGLPSVPLTREHLELPDLIFDEIIETIGEDEVKINLQKNITINFPTPLHYRMGAHTMARYEAILALTEENLDLLTLKKKQKVSLLLWPIRRGVSIKKNGEFSLSVVSCHRFLVKS